MSTVLLLLLLAGVRAGDAEAPDRLAEGVRLFEATDYAEAQRFFTAIDRGSEGAWVDYYLGRVHLQQEEVEAAIERLIEATETEPDSSLFHLWLGDAYVQRIEQVGMLKKMGLAKKARTSFERAVELSPRDYEAREALMGYYLNAPAIAGGGRDKAEQQVAEMKKIDPTKGHLMMGRIHSEDEDWKAAAGEYRQAIEAGDRSAEAYYRLGFAMQQDGDHEAAFSAFEEAIVMDPGDLSAYYQIGRTAIFSKTNLDRAVECLSFYVEQPPQRGLPGVEHAHWRLGMVYELQDKDELAASEYRAALQLDAGHDEARKALKALGRS